MKAFALIIKRLIDFIFALTLLVISIPLILTTAIVLRFSIGPSILFRQQRPGKDEVPFYIYKFRTMTNEKDPSGSLLSDEKRLTKVGSIIRSLSLDELPQLFNVLKGDISLVGPRPLLMQYLPLYNEQQRKRHLMLPGITGLAQINGRNSINWEDKFKYDLEYIESWSLLLDFKILLKTVAIVFQRKGVNSSKNTPMPPFKGDYS